MAGGLANLAGDGDLSVDERTRVRSGFIGDIGHLVVFNPAPEDGDPEWDVINRRELAELPPGIVPQTRMGQKTRLTKLPLKFKMRKGVAVFKYFVFGRVEKGKIKNP